MKHPSREEIDAYLHRQSGFFRTLQCCLHLRKCKECQAVFRSCREDQELIDSIRQAQEDFDYPEDPEEIQHLSAIFDKKEK